VFGLSSIMLVVEVVEERNEAEETLGLKNWS
jgi:hypothetical protein